MQRFEPHVSVVVSGFPNRVRLDGTISSHKLLTLNDLSLCATWHPEEHFAGFP